MTDLIELTQEMINNVFIAEYKADEPNQFNILIALYRIAFPNWDNIRKLNGWPKISDLTSKYIARKFIEFDEKYHPNCLRGGLWLNSGFSIDTNCNDWMIYPIESNKIFYKGDINRIKKVYIMDWKDDTTNESYGRIQFVRQFQLNQDRHESFWYHHLTDSSKRRIDKIKSLAQEIKSDGHTTNYTFTWSWG